MQSLKGNVPPLQDVPNCTQLRIAKEKTYKKRSCLYELSGACKGFVVGPPQVRMCAGCKAFLYQDAKKYNVKNVNRSIPKVKFHGN